MIDNYILALKPKYAASRGMFAATGHKGYTNVVSAAGRFSEKEALDRQSEMPDKYAAIRLDPIEKPVCEWEYLGESAILDRPRIQMSCKAYPLTAIHRGRYYNFCPSCGGEVKHTTKGE